MRLALVAVAAALVLVAPGTAAPQKTKLTGAVNPDFTITLKKDGKLVKTLPGGAYMIVVQDKSGIHDFHLTGPGLNKTTTVEFVGTKTWIVALKKGTYRYVCDPHSFQMKGSFKVT